MYGSITAQIIQHTWTDIRIAL